MLKYYYTYEDWILLYTQWISIQKLPFKIYYRQWKKIKIYNFFYSNDLKCDGVTISAIEEPELFTRNLSKIKL